MEFQKENLQTAFALPGIIFSAGPGEGDIVEGDRDDEDDEDFDDELEARDNLNEIRRNEDLKEIDPEDDDHLPDDDLQ